MLLEYQEKELMAGEKLPPFPYPMRLMHKYIENAICRGGGGGVDDLILFFIIITRNFMMLRQ